MIIIGTYFVIAPVISNPAAENYFILAALLVGFVLYVVFVYYKFTFGWISTFTFYMR